MYYQGGIIYKSFVFIRHINIQYFSRVTTKLLNYKLQLPKNVEQYLYITLTFNFCSNFQNFRKTKTLYIPQNIKFLRLVYSAC